MFAKIYNIFGSSFIETLCFVVDSISARACCSAEEHKRSFCPAMSCFAVYHDIPLPHSLPPSIQRGDVFVIREGNLDLSICLFINFLQVVRLFRAVFNWVSKIIRNCFGFALLRSVIGLKKLAPPSQPIRCKTKTNLDTEVALVFPRLAPVTCICLECSLVHYVV